MYEDKDKRGLLSPAKSTDDLGCGGRETLSFDRWSQEFGHVLGTVSFCTPQ